MAHGGQACVPSTVTVAHGGQAPAAHSKSSALSEHKMATVRLHPDAVSFMAACGDLLLSHVAMNQHLLSNAHNTSLDSTSRLLFSVLDGNDQVVAAVVVAQVMNRQSFVAANIAGALSPDAAKAVVQSARMHPSSPASP